MKHMLVVSLVMCCVSNVTYAMLWRGEHATIHHTNSDPLLNEECCICFEQKEVRDILCESQHGHSDKICNDCLDACIRCTGTCPLCRSQLQQEQVRLIDVCKKVVSQIYVKYCNFFGCG